MRRAFAGSFSCLACCRDVLRSIVAVPGVTIPQPLHSNSTLRKLNALSGVRRWQSTHETAEKYIYKDSRGRSQHTPWYLETSPQTLSPHPLGQQQELPPLPENPPVILQSILQHLLADIGLDNLTLLDLRGRDPPPALGGNLLMIVGSARSTKHLNVSADRFCRWLRSTFKLRPYADGLLGRNELKIKLRRKARRAKNASLAGTPIEPKDDGITTGWICVNVGIVEDFGSATQKAVREEAFEGFGKSAAGTRIVVQMFTEEKRAEIDLETLWGTDSLETTEARSENISSEDQVDEATPMNDGDKEHASNRSVLPVLKAPVSLGFNQKRGFSTNLARCNDNPNVVKPSQTLNFSSSKHDEQPLSALFLALSQLPPERIREELGEGLNDKSSTFLLQFLHREISDASPPESSTALLKLMCVGITAGHSSYSRRELFDAFEKHVGNGHILSDELGFEIFSALLTPWCEVTVETNGTPDASLSDFHKGLALEVLDYLSLRGTNVLDMKVINLLYEYNMISSPASTFLTEDISDDDPINHHRPIRSNATRLSKFIDSIPVPFDRESIHVQMELRFRHGDFDGFWDLWRSFSFNKVARTTEDYALLFRLHAGLGVSDRARDCLMTWVFMMDREEPPVPLQGVVAEQVMACALLADDTVSEREHNGPSSSVGKIWERCVDTLALR